MGSKIPKQYLTINSEPLLLHSLRRLSSVSSIKKIVVVIHPEDAHWSQLEASIEPEIQNRIITVIGGDERYQSVLNGLGALTDLAQAEDWVLVHDAVRPCVRTLDIERLIEELAEGSDPNSIGGLLGSEVDNTLKRVDEDLTVVKTVDRALYWNALTPQMFRFSLLKKAIEAVVASSEPVTDEAAAMESAGHRPIMVPGNKDNIKVTREADLLLATQILEAQRSETLV